MCNDYREEFLHQSIKKADELISGGFDVEAETKKVILECEVDDGDLGHCSACGLSLTLFKVCNMLYMACPRCKLKCLFQSGGSPTDLETSTYGVAMISGYKTDENLWSK